MLKKVFKPALNIGIITAMLGVIIGAMGAHALKNLVKPTLMESYETAVRYQFYHCFALLIVGILYAWFPSIWLRRATYFFTAGIILFSGSIYVLVLLKSTSDIGLGGLGILTPIGGVSLIIGWLLLFIGINTKDAANA